MDTEAEYEISILQEIITAARELKSDLKIDRKTIPDATLVLRPKAVAVGQNEKLAIEKMGGLRLTLQTEPVAEPSGVVRSSLEFDLIVQAPKADGEAQKARLKKENEQLEKVIANSKRQLSDEKFVGRAPAHIIDTLRQKLSEYEAQFQKNQESLGA
jgi:valyl-tRNA synthetase